MPAPKVAISREQGGTRAAFAIQQQTQKVATQANNVRPGMITVKDLIFVVGTNTYAIHGLGRIPQGYAIVNIRPHPTIAATGAQGAQRNLTTDPTNDETKALSLGPWQPFLADVEVW